MAIQTVLLVDDEPDIRRIAEITLRSVGKWTVLLASSGAEAIDIARQKVPDLILLDVMMPKMDGPATLAKLKADPVTAKIPVLFLTAKTQRRQVEELVSLGAAGVLSKPFDPMSLPAEIRRALGSE